MLDGLIDLIVGRFLTRTAITAHDHVEALEGHPLLKRVFFFDLKGVEVVDQTSDSFICTDTYNVTI